MSTWSGSMPAAVTAAAAAVVTTRHRHGKSRMMRGGLSDNAGGSASICWLTAAAVVAATPVSREVQSGKVALRSRTRVGSMSTWSGRMSAVVAKGLQPAPSGQTGSSDRRLPELSPTLVVPAVATIVH